jgi:hypothetical protein
MTVQPSISVLLSPLVTRPPSPQLLDARQITSPDQIAIQLSLLAKREADVTQALNALISDRSSIDRALAQLDQLNKRVQGLTLEVDRPTPRTLDLTDGVRPPGGTLGLVDDSRRNGSIEPRNENGRRESYGPVNGEGSLSGRGIGDEEVGMVERVRKVWETSERVGGKVRRLDEEVSRVREATEVVTEVLELKVSWSSLHVAP